MYCSWYECGTVCVGSGWSAPGMSVVQCVLLLVGVWYSVCREWLVCSWYECGTVCTAPGMRVVQCVLLLV